MATIQQLKAVARLELQLSNDEVREYGSLTRKATWEKAIAANTLTVPAEEPAAEEPAAQEPAAEEPAAEEPAAEEPAAEEPAAEEPAAQEAIFRVGDRVYDVLCAESNLDVSGTVTKLLSSGKVLVNWDIDGRSAVKPKYLQKIISKSNAADTPSDSSNRLEAGKNSSSLGVTSTPVQNESVLSDLFTLVPLSAPAPSAPSGVATETASFVPLPPAPPTVPLPEPEPEPEPEKGEQQEEETPVFTIAPGVKVRRNQCECEFRHTARPPDETGIVTRIDTQNHRAFVRWPGNSHWIKMTSLIPISQPKNTLALTGVDAAAVDRFKDKPLWWLKKYVRDRGACDTFVARFGEYILGRQHPLYPINSRQAWFEVSLWLESGDRNFYRYFCGLLLHPDELAFISKIGLDSDFWKEIKTLTFYRGIYANNYLDFYYEVCCTGSIQGAARYFGYPLSRKDGYIPGRCSDRLSEPATSLFFQVHQYLFNEWAKRSESALSDQNPEAFKQTLGSPAGIIPGVASLSNASDSC